MLRLLRTTEGRVVLLALTLGALALGISIRNSLDRQPPVVAAEMRAEDRSTLAGMQRAFEAIAEAVEPTVVSIQAVHVDRTPRPRGGFSFQFPDDEFFAPFRDFFRRFEGPDLDPGPYVDRSSGSGFIVRAEGDTAYILTNEHVVSGASRVKVRLGDDENTDVPATIVGTDDKTDLAVLKITLDKPLPPNRVAKLGDSNQVRVGQWAIAIGNPLGVGQTLTVGVVSAKNREVNGVQGIRSYRDMIQTDASINPGNSGGPLVDIEGRVIGINTAIASPTGVSVGIGFAIPVNTAKAVLDTLIKRGTVTRGWLGVETASSNRELSPELAEFYGVKGGALVDRVTPGGPADRAGIQPEDVIIQWGDKPIRNFSDLEDAVTSTPPGEKVQVRIVRNKREMTLTVTTGKRPSEEELMRRIRDRSRPDEVELEPQAETTRPDVLGITVRSISSEERARLGLPEGGVMIFRVTPDGRAADAGLAAGDVILKVNGKPVNSVSEYRSAMSGVGNRPVILRVFSRAGGSGLTRTVVVR
ncbi:MAG: trypsin-like peptidase domain-containing protein [Armatimonadota bacterium]